MREILRQAHAIAAWVFVGAILVQVFLAGAAIAQLGGSGDFTTHMEFGYTWVGLIALIVLLTAIAARRGRRDIGLSFGLLLLYVIQTILPGFKATIPSVAALHPVNALLLFGLALWYARHAWAVRNVEAPSSSTGDVVPAAR
jgi:uncharacterized membrane protein YhaH (DUF805 family)